MSSVASVLTEIQNQRKKWNAEKMQPKTPWYFTSDNNWHHYLEVDGKKYVDGVLISV